MPNDGEAAFSNRPKDGTFRDACSRQQGLNRSDRASITVQSFRDSNVPTFAFLIVFGSAQLYLVILQSGTSSRGLNPQARIYGTHLRSPSVEWHGHALCLV
jgi:hypothetical protein